MMVLQPICRRKSDPRAVQKLWAGITYIRSQKQVANIDRLTRYVHREFDMPIEEAERQLDLAIEDGLVMSYSAVANKGSHVGVEQDGFRISPEEGEETRSTHDWYCYDCHKPGDVLECCECWRVYHVDCTDTDTNEDIFICAVCRDIKKQPRMKRKELNRLLSFTIVRLKDKSKELHWFGGRDLGLDRFVFHYMDLNTMQERTAERRYKYLEQFYSDARIILHNIFICYGDTGIIPDLARVMIRDCRYDLDEIRLCKDCYLHSNARTKDWFCEPCNPAHELVYAKQTGFSYWPAKVIKITQEGHDVRFFGALHQRAIIQKTAVKPIDSTLKQLAVKRTAGFNRALAELERHRELLQAAVNGGDTNTGQESDDQSTGDNDEDGDEPESIPKRVNPSKYNDDNSADDVEEKDELSGKKRKKKQSKLKQSKKSPHKKHKSMVEDGSDHLPLSGRLSGKGRGAHSSEDTFHVSSTEDRLHDSVSRIFTMSDIGIQTSRKLSLGGRRMNKSTQTDVEGDGVKEQRKEWSELEAVKLAKGCGGESNGMIEASSEGSRAGTCDCEIKYSRIYEEVRERMERESKEDKERALQELEERLRADFDADRQRTVSRAVSNVQREAERVRRETEERCREELEEELKKVTQKHKHEVSTAKKKQWCYNCEEEAMYHCCWNTSYCSIKCQQEHWHTEHKRSCRRKRT